MDGLEEKESCVLCYIEGRLWSDIVFWCVRAVRGGRARAPETLVAIWMSVVHRSQLQCRVLQCPCLQPSWLAAEEGRWWALVPGSFGNEPVKVQGCEALRAVLRSYKSVCRILLLCRDLYFKLKVSSSMEFGIFLHPLVGNLMECERFVPPCKI